MKNTLRAFSLLLMLQYPLYSQNIEVGIQDLDFLGLPRVTFTACVTSSDTLFPPLDASNFVFTENGVQHPLIIRCPESGLINSVMLVVDNSGSIAPVLGKISEAASILVDSLGASDEAAVLTFSRDIVLRQDFTTDKVVLKQALNAMQAGGGTPLRDAAYQGCKLLQMRQGKRHMVILTDGQDTQSVLSNVDSVIILANAANIRIYSIAFALIEEYEKEMKRMGEETGGLFFSVQRPSELNAVYARIAALITEPCCTAEYYSMNCEDSIRVLTLSANVLGDTASTSLTVSTPYRASTTHLWVEVPSELNGNQTGTGMVYIEPPPSTDLELTLGFTLNYNDDLISISPPFAQSLGTITQNQNVQLTKIGPSKMRFTMNRIKPALFTNKLAGFPLLAQRSDSSRDEPVAFVDSITIEGCPVDFTTAPDTTRVCSCYQALPLEMNDISYITAGHDLRIVMQIPSGLAAGIGTSLSFDFYVSPDVKILSIEPGSLFNAVDMLWVSMQDGWVHVEVPGFALPRDTAGSIIELVTRPPVLRDAAYYKVKFRDQYLMQRCCPEEQQAKEYTFFVDGLCDKLVRHRASVSVTTSPNPVRLGITPEINVTATLSESHPGGLFGIRIVDLNGAVVRTIPEREFAPGTSTVPIPVGDLPSGTYLAVFSNDRERVSSHFIVVR